MNVVGFVAESGVNLCVPVTTKLLVVAGGAGAISSRLSLNGANILFNNKRLQNVATPTTSTDAATKGYVDAVASNLHVHQSCYVATTGTLAAASGGTTSYNNGTSGVGATIQTTGTFYLIDGGNVQTVGTRILVKNEANAAWNGIYTYTNTTTITRSTDFDAGTEMSSSFVFVEDGTNVADTGWVCTNNSSSPITIGTTAITFTQFSGAGSYTAGNALSLSGTTFNVNTDGNIGINGSNGSNYPTAPQGLPGIRCFRWREVVFFLWLSRRSDWVRTIIVFLDWVPTWSLRWNRVSARPFS